MSDIILGVLLGGTPALIVGMLFGIALGRKRALRGNAPRSDTLETSQAAASDKTYRAQDFTGWGGADFELLRKERMADLEEEMKKAREEMLDDIARRRGQNPRLDDISGWGKESDGSSWHRDK